MSSSIRSLQFLTRDKTCLLLTRFFRLLDYGSLSVVLVFYFAGLGLTETQTGGYLHSFWHAMSEYHFI
jgi:hypothetical protein